MYTKYNQKYSTEEAQAICSTMLEQLGGQARLRMMIGAKNYGFSQIENQFVSLTFQFMKAGAGVGNRIRITLDANDLYNVEIFNIRKFEVKVTHSINGLYGDSLAEWFMDNTGLELRIPKVVGINA